MRRRRRLSRRIHSQPARPGLDGQAPARGLLGVRVGADHQTADTQERKAGKDESNGKQVHSNGWRTFPAGGLGAIPGRGPEIPQAA